VSSNKLAAFVVALCIFFANTALAAGAGGYAGGAPVDRHFDPKGKEPSSHTLTSPVIGE